MMNLVTLAFILLPSCILVEAFVLPTTTRAVVGGVQLKTTQLFGILNRFRKKKEIVEDIPETIEVGGIIPNVDVEVLTTDEEGTITSVPIAINEVLGNGTSILIGMPGAFTPVCTSIHLPGYIEASGKLRQLGVEKIAVVTQNDKFVTTEWARSVGLIKKEGSEGALEVLETPITLLADGDGDLINAMGLAGDMGFGLGIRSKRFALIANAGEVTTLLLDDGTTECIETSAMNLIKLLSPTKSAVEDANSEGVDSTALAGAAVVIAAAAYFLYSGGEGSGEQAGSAFSLLNSYSS